MTTFNKRFVSLPEEGYGPRMGSGGLDLEEIARRLRALQQALGQVPNEQMAAWAGVTAPAWANYVLGSRPIPPEAVASLKKRWGITLDWVFTGDAARNDPELQKDIDLALKHPIPPKRGRRPLEG
jgi:hypothetical protein